MGYLSAGQHAANPADAIVVVLATSGGQAAICGDPAHEPRAPFDGPRAAVLQKLGRA